METKHFFVKAIKTGVTSVTGVTATNGAGYTVTLFIKVSVTSVTNLNSVVFL
jgi:hypothetical protein